MPFMHFGLPGFMPLILILLILGLAFRSAMKGFLILIAVILAAVFLFKIVGLIAWPHVIHAVL
jgi:predicted RND superfamily exporter protein